jgi:hypothetical protein
MTLTSKEPHPSTRPVLARCSDVASSKAAATPPAVALLVADKPGHAGPVPPGHRNRASRRKRGGRDSVQNRTVPTQSRSASPGPVVPRRRLAPAGATIEMATAGESCTVHERAIRTVAAQLVRSRYR